MKTFTFQTIAAALVLSLAACQPQPPLATPTQSAANEFFHGEQGRWITVEPPAGWVAQLAGTDITPMIVVTDNWAKYENDNPDSIGIILVPLSDKGPAEDVLAVATDRLADSLKEQVGEVVTEQGEGHEYAWAEYTGRSFPDGAAQYLLLAVIATEHRSALVFVSVNPGQQQALRPMFQNVVKAITLH